VLKRGLAACALVFAAGACKRTRADGPSAALSTAPAEASALPGQNGLAPGAHALVVDGGREKLVDAAQAEKSGLTLVDLSDGWTPYIFEELPGKDGQPLGNRYRQIYLGLANDTGDPDGQPLIQPDEKTGKRKKKLAPAGPPAPPPHNYLELYGIPPTLSVMRARFLEDDPGTDGGRCKEVDWEKIRATTTMPTVEPKFEARERLRITRLARDLEKRRRAAKVATLDELVEKQPRWKRLVAQLAREPLAKVAFPEVEKRLACEDMFRGKLKHAPGHFDDPMRDALIRFQLKHKIYDGAAFRSDTMAALGKPPLELDQAALERVIAERAVSAADVLEDGSVEGKDGGPPTYTAADGSKKPVRNLAKEATDATLQQLGIATPDAALAFFKRHPKEDFQDLRAAVKIAPPPEYYSPEMDLSVIIDRGDVFYEPPFDEQGKPLPQVRKHYPRLTLRVRWHDQTIPLVRWRTTIGGWRSDLASNGYEYFRYKGSDIGPRVWRNIVAGPVWIAPNSTPIRTLVKWKTVRGIAQQVVNYDEVGPGYLSAYGLVAAYNVVPGKDGKPDWDNGVRVHGSSEFRSMFNPEGYSHGCHRLVNHLAVRMFSFVLRHRHMTVEGDQPLGFARQFLWKEDVYEMRLPTRGYRFVLDPPLPLNVLEGNLMGERKKPITTYVPKPGVAYPPGPMPVPPDSPEARAGGGDD
jgi:hypothetical protein